MIVDVEQGNHKMIWYTAPKGLENVAKLQVQKWKIVKLDEKTDLHFYVSIYQHKSLVCNNKKPLTIWIGSKQDVENQLKEIYEKSGLNPETTDFLKLVPNIENLEGIKMRNKLTKKESEIMKQKHEFWNMIYSR